jgi:hypothetical protein
MLSERIIEEISYAFSGRRNGWWTKMILPVVHKPAQLFGSIAADFYEQVNHLGIRQGAAAALHRFRHMVQTRGECGIPSKGPLLLVSNHPGGLDSLSILTCMPRNDLQALVSDVALLHQLDYEHRYLIFVDFKTTGGMLALRDAIRHLESGGALLLFAHGDVEPEPESFPTARDEINKWSPSIEILLRKVPETTLQILTVSGAVQARYLRSPVTLIRRQPGRRQKLAEFLQVITALLLPNIKPIRIHITAGAPIRTSQLGEGRWMPEILEQAQCQMDDHLHWVKTISPKA